MLQRNFQLKVMTPESMREIRNSIRGLISDVFAKSVHKISDNATTWLTDQYFKSIKLNEDTYMSDQVVINEYTLDELEFKDIELMKNLFKDTSLSDSINIEHKRRKSMS